MIFPYLNTLYIPTLIQHHILSISNSSYHIIHLLHLNLCVARPITLENKISKLGYKIQ